jgi:hypothetical protein
MSCSVYGQHEAIAATVACALHPAPAVHGRAQRAQRVGEWSQLGGRFYALHVPTLDNVDREELANAPLNFVDNAHDRPDRAPADTRLL